MLLEAWKEFEVNNDEFIVRNDPKPQLCAKGKNSRESSTRRSLNAWNARETLPRISRVLLSLRMASSRTPRIISCF